MFCATQLIPQTGNEIKVLMAPWEDVLPSVVPRKTVPHEVVRWMRKERRKKWGNEVVLKAHQKYSASVHTRLIEQKDEVIQAKMRA